MYWSSCRLQRPEVRCLKRLQPIKILSALLDVGFRRIEQHTLLELIGPEHQYLHKKLATRAVPAPNVDDGVLFQRAFGDQLPVADSNIDHFCPVPKRQQCILKTDEKVRATLQTLLEVRSYFRTRELIFKTNIIILP